MSLFKRLLNPFTRRTLGAGRSLDNITVHCLRCGEIITGPVDLRNDLSIEYDDSGRVTGYNCRKLFMGRQRCFQQIEVTLRYDDGHRLIDKQVSGGKFVEPSETSETP